MEVGISSFTGVGKGSPICGNSSLDTHPVPRRQIRTTATRRTEGPTVRMDTARERLKVSLIDFQVATSHRTGNMLGKQPGAVRACHESTLQLCCTAMLTLGLSNMR